MEKISYEGLLTEIREYAEKTVRLCRENGIKIATAESCTGGMVSAAITAVSGSSAVIELGVCSYSNRIKSEFLGVSEDILRENSEYSTECAKAMAEGVKLKASADFGISTTGVAGPTGGTSEHPVGEVCIGVSGRNTTAARLIFPVESGENFSERDYIRASAAKQALCMLHSAIREDISTER